MSRDEIRESDQWPVISNQKVKSAEGKKKRAITLVTRHSVMPSATLLPGGADCVLGDQGIGCQERQFMLDGLANQYAVKWVAVKQW